jgi:hypothetical protein
MVFKLQLFLIYSFLYVFLDPHRNFHFGEEVTIFSSFVQMWDNVMYVNPCYNVSGIENQFI